jgi:lactoylglutathione lyase
MGAASPPFEIAGFSHVGIRVADAERACEFYARLGFALHYTDEKDPVLVLRNAAGVELNLVVNAVRSGEATNILMDVPQKHAGITHFAVRVPSIERAVAALGAAGIAITEGPVRLGDGVSCFVRDPDRNVIELREEQGTAP